MRSNKLADASGEVLVRVFSGHGSPRKSKNTQGFVSGKPDPIHWVKRTKLKKALRKAAYVKRCINLAKARDERFERKRLVPRMPCFRRFREQLGFTANAVLSKHAYTAKPKLMVRYPRKMVYELIVAFTPFCTFTDVDEAFLSAEAMQANGYPAIEVKAIEL